jgi:hypothetical protein
MDVCVYFPEKDVKRYISLRAFDRLLHMGVLCSIKRRWICVGLNV